MNVLRGLGPPPNDIGATVAAIGAFAIVHRGHEHLLARVRDEAARLGATPAVVTFDRHPAETLRPEEAPCQLATLDQRIGQLSDARIDVALVLEFTEELSELHPEEFVRRVLVDRLNVRKVVVGEDFRFGHDRAGDPELLAKLGAALGFDVEAIDLLLGNGEKISASDIRRLIGSGEMGRVTELVGVPYRLWGTVVRGDGRGRELGFPTANVEPGERACLPATGVYAGRWIWRGERFPGAINVGVRPTFTPSDAPIVEVHVLDLDRDLYGESGEVEFVARLRDEERFESPDALVEQMHRDVEDTRRLVGGG